VGRKGLRRKKGSNLSPDEIKKRIMIHLYKESEGLNQNQIRAIPTLNSADWNFLAAILAELCVVGKLEADTPDDYKEGQWTFTLTGEGRDFIEQWKKMKGLGSGFSFFENGD